MPKHDTHEAMSKLVLGRPYRSVNQALDWPVRFLGPSHRKMFHSLPEAVLIGIMSSGNVEGGVAGIMHLLLDDLDSGSKSLLRHLIEGAR